MLTFRESSEPWESEVSNNIRSSILARTKFGGSRKIGNLMTGGIRGLFSLSLERVEAPVDGGGEPVEAIVVEVRQSPLLDQL